MLTMLYRNIRKPSSLIAIFVVLLIHIRLVGQGNYNLTELANPPSTCLNGFNDVWGFEHSNGTEYAILGTRCGTSIYDLSVPATPQLVADIPGPPGVWRDMKTFGDNIYVVADQGSLGIQVINMKDTSQIKSWHFNPVVGNDTMYSAHNLYIDEIGFMYIAGSQLNGGGGVVIFNINLNDSTPPIVGLGPAIYAHDVYVNEARGLMFTSDIYNHAFSIHTLDRSDSMQVSVNSEASQETGGRFTHNTWASLDGNVLFTTDEVSGAFVEAYDISNLDDIYLLDNYAPATTLSSNVLPHNVHIKDQLLFVSYYSEGIKVIDFTRPSNLVEIASYDTNLATSGSNGCWGAFPYFNSGLILASDISNGLFVLDPEDLVNQSAYLEGLVIDQDGLPIDSAFIEIQSINGAFEYSRSGTYSTGIVDQEGLTDTIIGGKGSNSVRVLVTKTGYQTKDTVITFIPGSIITQDFILTLTSLPVELISFSVKQNGCENHLLWEVGSATNHSHFEMESSQNGLTFNMLQSFYPKDAINNVYQFWDTQSGRENYYRLKQVDLDGSTSYSKVLFTTNSCISVNPELMIFPNPVSNFIYIRSTEQINSIIVNGSDGKVYLKVDAPADMNKLDITHLAPGIYFAEIRTTDIRKIFKILKVR